MTTDPTVIFSYGVEQRLQCTSCRKVSYRTDATDVVSVSIPATEKGKDADGKTLYEDVKLTDCIDHLLGREILDYNCPSCATNVQAVKCVPFRRSQLSVLMACRSTKFASLPEVLVVHAKKFQLVNWVPTKLGKIFSLHDSVDSLKFGNIRTTDIPVILPDNDELTFTEAHLGKGLQDGEIVLRNVESGPFPLQVLM